MAFCVLLVTKDDQAVETLTPVLSNFGLRVLCCNYPDAVCLVKEQKFQSVLVDFDDPHSATIVLDNVSNAPFENHAITIALLSDPSKVRAVFGAGANFVLYKPITAEQADATLRAAIALIKRERRKSFRVPVQVPISLRLESDNQPIDGILLDLSEHGMDVLADQPLYSSADLNVRFTLPDSCSEFEFEGEVAWANPNGESGIRFTGTPENLAAALRRWLLDHAREISQDEIEPVPDCRLTDLSLGGCYVETPSALPERTHVVLTLRAQAVELHAQGLVRVMHPAYGMGIEFVVRTAAQRHQTEEFIRFLTSRSRVQPDLLVSPQILDSATDTLVAPPDVEDPLLELLRNHESFSQEMFLQALRSQRKAETAPSLT
jgi:CheY-like chemotaxis protein